MSENSSEMLFGAYWQAAMSVLNILGVRWDVRVLQREHHGLQGGVRYALGRQRLILGWSQLTSTFFSPDFGDGKLHLASVFPGQQLQQSGPGHC